MNERVCYLARCAHRPSLSFVLISEMTASMKCKNANSDTSTTVMTVKRNKTHHVQQLLSPCSLERDPKASILAPLLEHPPSVHGAIYFLG
jgi:hypothetical protein